MGNHLPSKKKLWDALKLLNFMGWCEQTLAQRLLAFLPFQSTFPPAGAAAPLSRVRAFSGRKAPSCQQQGCEPPAQARVLSTAFRCAALCARTDPAAAVRLLLTSYSSGALVETFLPWQRARAFLCRSTNLRNSFLK